MKAILQHPLFQKHGMKFFRFGVCGGLGACIDFGVLDALVRFGHWHEKYALIVSTGLAMIFVFTANRFFTFRVQGKGAGQQALKFFLVYLCSAILNYLLSLGFIALGVHYLLAKAIAIGTMMILNYVLLHRFVFRALSVDQ